MSHETDSQAARRRLRRDSGHTARGNLISYRSIEGDSRDWPGDEEAPYVKVVGPRHGQADEENPVKIGGHATSGARANVDEDDRVDASFTLDGKLRVESTSAGGTTEVEGTVAHDDPDADNPVKTGGHANASPRSNVSAEDDRADHSVDLRGRQRVRVSGDNRGNGLDVEIGSAADFNELSTLLGAKDPSLGEEGDAGVTTDGDGSVIAQLRGLVRRASEAALGLFAVGNEPHDDPDTNNPVKVGGKAHDETPAAVADGDRVNHYYTEEGRAIVNQDLPIAGENLVHDYLAVHTKALDVEQGSWDDALGSDVSSLVVKTSAGRLRKVIVSNTSGSARWLQVFNATSLPSAGTESDVPGVEIPADSHVIVDFTEIGAYFDTGIVLGVSLEIEDLSPPSTTSDFDIWALFK